ncbi:M36 family metallopeptidase [Roseimicrobium sp. ORNL1]|uniref:M36 family metallopeptidase n=1 Tax=Roseimicrobium sp. ORNL1 TaxID=2711231 RepID=UPI0013E1F3E1|nr:M36 family metallopeptidase [Roseimicrobium sp. ORNL1]QIF01669.1 peptidase M36 [Roseimicrobium sp. ORNL1]
MPGIKALKAKVELNPVSKMPRRIYDFRSKASKSKPRTQAVALLKGIAKDLQIQPDLKQLKFDKVNETLLGSHVLFQQYHEGKPISGAWVRVDIDKSGRIYNVQSDLVPEKNLEKAASSKAKSKSKAEGAGTAAKALSAEQAVARAKEAISAPAGSEVIVESQELVFLPVNGVPVSAWKLVLRCAKPAAEYRMYVDSQSGAILEKLDQLKSANGTGRIFDPNPVVALNDTTLEDDSPIPDAAYRTVELRDLDGTGFLDGPFVSTSNTPNRVQRQNLNFSFSRSQRAFKEVMVYFHIDRVQRYIQELGFDNILNGPIKVHIDGRSDDNSHYSPATQSLTFGTGGVDDAEDAEIILHEYGHAIQDNQVPGFGQTKEGQAMGEGFGDYLAASFFASAKPANLQPTVGSWDAVAYSGDNPPNLRRMDSTKKYPRDMVGEEHSDGEIWSAALWELRNAVGSRTADQLVLAHHFQLTRNATFEDGANALITVDEVLNEGRNISVIRDIFTRRGILTNTKLGKRAGAPFPELYAPRRPRAAKRARRAARPRT